MTIMTSSSSLGLARTAARAYLARLGFLQSAAPSAPRPRRVDLPGVTGQVRFIDKHGHKVTAYRRGRSSWVLDHTSHSGGEVLRFFTTAQLVDELDRRQEIAVEVTSGITA